MTSKIQSLLISVLISMGLSSCDTVYSLAKGDVRKAVVGDVSTPGFTVVNFSDFPGNIYNIKADWNGVALHFNSILKSRQRRANINPALSTFNGNFFGTITVRWQDANKKPHSKTIEFKPEHLPNYSAWGKNRYNEVYFFFEQDDVTFVTTDHPYFKEIEYKLAGDWVKNPYRGTIENPSPRYVQISEEATRSKRKFLPRYKEDRARTAHERAYYIDKYGYVQSKSGHNKFKGKKIDIPDFINPDDYIMNEFGQAIKK